MRPSKRVRLSVAPYGATHRASTCTHNHHSIFSNVDHLLVAPDGATPLIHQRRALRRDSSHQAVGPHSQGALQQRCVTCHAAPCRRGSMVSRPSAHLFAAHGTGRSAVWNQSTVALPRPSRRMARQRTAHATGHPQFDNLKVHATSRLLGATNARLSERVEDDRRAAWRDRSDFGTHPHL